MLQPQVLTAKAASYPGLNVAGIEGTVLATIVADVPSYSNAKSHPRHLEISVRISTLIAL